VFVAYGSGLVLGYRPTFAVALHLQVTVFGWCWIGAGLFLLTGLLVTKDRWHFAVAALVMAAWALLLATHWEAPYGWAAAVSWMGPCALAILIASWPETPRL
jgi:NhaP-type Na+/H+ and K+/H+ antiporter